MDNAYSRAVDLFEALMQAPSGASHQTPAALFQAAGVAPTSGYRHVAALEAEGLIRRDPAGTYLPGTHAIRIGFSGFGMGHLAPLAQPILISLRQATQNTAFLGIVRDLDLHMGPYSVGRETRASHLQPLYDFETIPTFALGAPTEVSLRSQEGHVLRRTSTLLAPVKITADIVVVLGVILPSGRAASEDLATSLESAAAQIIDADREGGA